MTDIPEQQNWFDMINQFGDEKKAEQEVARKLREIADQIESGTYPRLFGIEFPKPDAKDAKFKSFIFTYKVTLSYPWPG